MTHGRINYGKREATMHSVARGEAKGECGTWTHATDRTEDRVRVTCRRCLASLAKRDREFRAKARRGLRVVRERLERAWFRDPSRWYGILAIPHPARDAAAAIAREEGNRA